MTEQSRVVPAGERVPGTYEIPQNMEQQRPQEPIVLAGEPHTSERTDAPEPDHSSLETPQQIILEIGGQICDLRSDYDLAA